MVHDFHKFSFSLFSVNLSQEDEPLNDSIGAPGAVRFSASLLEFASSSREDQIFSLGGAGSDFSKLPPNSENLTPPPPPPPAPGVTRAPILYTQPSPMSWCEGWVRRSLTTVSSSFTTMPSSFTCTTVPISSNRCDKLVS
jgi:hypothetical protein